MAATQAVAIAELRVGVVGAGLMGTQHIQRISRRIAGARVTGIVEPAPERLTRALADAPGAIAFETASALMEEVDALLVATHGDLHEPVLLEAIERGIPVFVEKPLTRDSASSLRVVEAEMRLQYPIIQVGFMRRFDSEYRQLKGMVDRDDFGALLTMHLAHRLPSYRKGAPAAMPVSDALVHEIDMIGWLTGESFRAIEVRRTLQNRLSAEPLIDPQLVLIEMASGRLITVELNVGVQFGYQVTAEAVFERAVVNCGRGSGPEVHVDGRFGGAEHASYASRFAAAFDRQLQQWADAARHGRIAGASCWDGYVSTLVAEAGVRSQRGGGRVIIESQHRPEFYQQPAFLQEIP